MGVVAEPGELGEQTVELGFRRALVGMFVSEIRELGRRIDPPTR